MPTPRNQKTRKAMLLQRRAAGRYLIHSLGLSPSEPLTMQEDLALDLIFEIVGERRVNRTMEEYAAIAAKLPPIKVLHGYANDRLREIAKDPRRPRGLCYFKPGDRRAWFKPYPKSILLEVLRSALVKSGMRNKQVRRPRTR